MGEPGDEKKFVTASQQAYGKEPDPVSDPNVVRYNQDLFRAMNLQRLDLIHKALKEQNELLAKLVSAQVAVMRKMVQDSEREPVEA